MKQDTYFLQESYENFCQSLISYINAFGFTKTSGNNINPLEVMDILNRDIDNRDETLRILLNKNSIDIVNKIDEIIKAFDRAALSFENTLNDNNMFKPLENSLISASAPAPASFNLAVMDAAYKKWQSIRVNSGADAIKKQKAWDEYQKAKNVYQNSIKASTPILALKGAMDLAKQKYDSITVNSGPDAIKKQKALEDYENAKKAYEDEFRRQLNKDTPSPTTTTPKPTPTTTLPKDTISKSPRPDVTTTPKPTPTKRMPTETISKRPEPDATTTPKPAVTTAKPAVTTPKPAVTTAKPAVTTPKPAVTTAKPTITPKPTQAPRQTVAPTPTVSPNPGGKPADDGVRSKLEDEIKRLREQVEKEQQERIKLEQQIQQQQTQQQHQTQTQPQVQAPRTNPTPAAQVVQPEQPTVAPTPEITIPGGNDSATPTVKPNTGTDTTPSDSPSLPNPNAGDGGSSKPNPSSSSSGGFNPLPWGIGLGAAVAGGVGVKAYANHRKNSKFDDENEDSVTNGNRFWTDEDPNVVHSEQDLFNQDDTEQEVSYQAVENSTDNNDTWNIEESELSDDNTFDLLSENN